MLSLAGSAVNGREGKKHDFRPTTANWPIHPAAKPALPSPFPTTSPQLANPQAKTTASRCRMLQIDRRRPQGLGRRHDGLAARYHPRAKHRAGRPYRKWHNMFMGNELHCPLSRNSPRRQEALGRTRHLQYPPSRGASSAEVRRRLQSKQCENRDWIASHPNRTPPGKSAARPTPGTNSLTGGRNNTC